MVHHQKIASFVGILVKKRSSEAGQAEAYLCAMQASVRCRHGVLLHPYQTCTAVNKLHRHTDTVSRQDKKSLRVSAFIMGASEGSSPESVSSYHDTRVEMVERVGWGDADGPRNIKERRSQDWQH